MLISFTSAEMVLKEKKCHFKTKETNNTGSLDEKGIERVNSRINTVYILRLPLFPVGVRLTRTLN